MGNSLCSQPALLRSAFGGIVVVVEIGRLTVVYNWVADKGELIAAVLSGTE